MNNQIIEYDNGPLPKKFIKTAYFFRNEWALPKMEAIEYLKWCEKNKIKAFGFDVWKATKPAPTVVEEECVSVIGTTENINAIQNCKESFEYVFNVCAERD